MVEAILADRGGLARLHCLEELIGVGTAAFLGLHTVDAIAAHDHHAGTSGGCLEDLLARRVDLGGHGWNNRWNKQQSDGKHENAQHERGPRKIRPAVAAWW